MGLQAVFAPASTTLHGHPPALCIEDSMDPESLMLHPHAATFELQMLSNQSCSSHELPLTLPSVESLVDSLHTCRSSKCLPSARSMHTSVCSSGLESYGRIGNHIVPMLAECGGIVEAHQAFIKLHDQNEHSWTSLIHGYVQSGDMDYALDLYPQMQGNNVSSSPHTLMALLRACVITGNLDIGQRMYVEIVQKGFETALYIGANLVALYIKCCLYVEARNIFHKIPMKDVTTWTSLISCYIEKGQAEDALEAFECMKQEGTSPNAHTYACVLKACNILRAVDVGREIHEEIRQSGHDSNPYVGSALVTLYASCGDLSEAQQIFDKLLVRDAVVWTALISGFVEYGHSEDTLQYFDEMRREGILPTATTFACVLKACGNIQDHERGRELHIEIERKGLSLQDPSVSNSLISMYAKCGSLIDSQYVFDKLPARDTVSWNALITGYSDSGSWEQSLKCFERMCVMGDKPNGITYSCLFKACSTPEALLKGIEIHEMIIGSEFEMNESVSSSLITMYAKCDSLTKAEEVFDGLPNKNIGSLNALIAGYAAHGLNQKVLDCFHSIQCKIIYPDSATFCCVLKACSSIGSLPMGREVHAQILWTGLHDEDPALCKSLITMYGSCGSLLQAEQAFEKLHFPDTAAWTLMIKYAGVNHDGKAAIQYFEGMLAQGVGPDAMAFTCLLTACCHASLVHEGKEYFKMMTQVFNLTPAPQHYNCIVNLISRTGHLYEAERFSEMLGCTSEETWSSLLNACKTYGEVELARRCFDQLEQINAEDSAWYVLMEDVYSNAGKPREAAAIEDIRKHVNARKLAAVASIEIDKKVHDFVVGEEPSEDMMFLLNDLSSRVKMKGHLPQLDIASNALSDGEKEAELCVHAEKLAIAFGLLNTPQGTTLRVSKNLRMCLECHSVSKLISKVERREIILRDSCCIHHFKDNTCSCGDMF